jgi:hypothetical protein
MRGMRYTLRNIPKNLDRALRARAKAEGKSLNKTLLDAIGLALGFNRRIREYDDLDWFFGGNSIDDGARRAIAEADVIHRDAWKLSARVKL